MICVEVGGRRAEAYSESTSSTDGPEIGQISRPCDGSTG